jgi:cobalt-zinc-cadmium efflux system membrane fusion protein
MIEKNTKRWLGLASGCVLLVGLLGFAGLTQRPQSPQHEPPHPPATKAADDGVTISDVQAKYITVVPAQAHDFASQLEAIGFIDFNQDRTVQVFTPYQGRVRQVFAKAGDDVGKGQALFTIDSPDLVQAESTLISTAGVLALTTRALERAKKMIDIQTNAQKDLEQSVSDQQTAEANYKAARDAVRIFGKSDAEMDKIVASRKVDGELVIASSLRGRVTARNVAPGLQLQPGGTPVPFTVADLSTMWMVASVPEENFAQLQLGQSVSVALMAYPGRQFDGQVTNIGATIDPNTHRIAVRTEINDPLHELRPQMLATYVIRTGAPLRGVAVPLNAMVREGDGTLTVFVTQDGHRFVRRPIKPGLEQDGLLQILEGLSAGEHIAGDGALFLSNALALQTR